VRLGIRECFIPRDGHLFAFADYSGLELCTVAQVCLSVLGKSKLAEDLNAGVDVHCKVAANLQGISYEEAVAWYDDYEHPDWQTIYKKRQTAKAANFGFPGGCGIARMIVEARSKYGVDLDEDQARDLKDAWITAYPEFWDYFRMVDERVKADLPFEQLFSGRLRGGCGFTDGANTLFQGLGGDAAKAAGFALTRECRIGKGPLRGGHPIVFAHDEFWVEVLAERAQEAAKEVGRIMVEAAKPYLRDVPVKAEPGLAKRWSKKAKAFYAPCGQACCEDKKRCKKGELIPWDG
jgi:DNA polymerase-1